MKNAVCSSFDEIPFVQSRPVSPIAITLSRDAHFSRSSFQFGPTFATSRGEIPAAKYTVGSFFRSEYTFLKSTRLFVTESIPSTPFVFAVRTTSIRSILSSNIKPKWAWVSKSLIYTPFLAIWYYPSRFLGFPMRRETPLIVIHTAILYSKFCKKAKMFI